VADGIQSGGGQEMDGASERERDGVEMKESCDLRRLREEDKETRGKKGNNGKTQTKQRVKE
jgi:hypothetical protein